MNVQGLTSKFEALQESLGSLSDARELLELTVSFAEAEEGAAPIVRDSAEAIQQQEAAFTAAAKTHLATLLQVCRECSLSVEECDKLRPTVDAATTESSVEVCATLLASLK